MRGENVFVDSNTNEPDRTDSRYCWKHKLNLDNLDKPTERDKKLIASIELKPFKTTMKNGVVIMGRACPRCHNQIIVKTDVQLGSKEGIIKVPKEGENADIYL
jgi:hypothetical protein